MKKLLKILPILIALCMPVGCTDLHPEGVYQGDKILFNAEDLIGDAKATFTDLFDWELAYYEKTKHTD